MSRDRILAALDALGPDEIEVIAFIVERLAAGRSVYGELQLDSDRRDFAREALEEFADAAIYSASGLVRDRRRTARSLAVGPARLLSERDADERPMGRLVGAERTG